ncbi:MAG: hypothetical protein WAU00_15695, partial [Caldilinea sp.]
LGGPFLHTLEEIAFVIGRDEERGEVGPVPEPRMSCAGILANHLLKAVGLHRGQGSVAALEEACEPIGQPRLPAGIDLGLEGIEC